MTNVDRAKKIKIVLMDVDGVLTDGKMYYIPDYNGKMVEFKAFNSLDGIGLRLLNQFGIIAGVISGRESLGTEERARILCMKYIYQGFVSKLEPFKEILKDSGFTPQECAYIGDDWTDIPVMKKAGFAAAPKNSLPEVKKAAHFVTKNSGGNGAVREVCNFILKSHGHWGRLMESVEAAHWPPFQKHELKIVSRSTVKKGV
ncbi:MAG: HAD hydrolase family protein [Elusimicrobia bacterium]|nr:HAD hydrolase family protein [Elusimicrobiota bacterium]